MSKHFFDEQREHSEVKSQIVSKYFEVWTKIMVKKSPSDRLAYIDLFSGPGRYTDGTKSTPIKILEQIIDDTILQKKMVVLFNDADDRYADSLRKDVMGLPGIDSLRFMPQVSNTVVGDEIVEQLKEANLVPSLSFIDPWGYKGLSSKLISAVIKYWGSDCIFFFNYNRINMGLDNPRVAEHMNAIFGSEKAAVLRKNLKGLRPHERERRILNGLVETFSEAGVNFVLPFRFLRPESNRTSHYLILVSKSVLAYTIMKDIMYTHSSEYDDGVASFSFGASPSPTAQLELPSIAPKLLDILGEELCTCFAGKRLTVKKLHEMHQVGKPYVLRNYKEALRRLEGSGKIVCDPSDRVFRNGVKTMADEVWIAFPQLNTQPRHTA